MRFFFFFMSIGITLSWVKNLNSEIFRESLLLITCSAHGFRSQVVSKWKSISRCRTSITRCRTSSSRCENVSSNTNSESVLTAVIFFLLNGSFVLDHIIAFVTESSTEGEHDPDKNLFMRMYYTHRFSGMQTSFLDDHCVYVLVRTKIVVETSSDRNSMVLKMIKQPSQIVWGILELCTRVISLYSNYMLWLRKTLAVTIGYSDLG